MSASDNLSSLVSCLRSSLSSDPSYEEEEEEDAPASDNCIGDIVEDVQAQKRWKAASPR